MKSRLVLVIWSFCLISIISVSALPPAFEHSRETIVKAFDSTKVSQGLEYGDKQFYNWNFSNPSDYSYNSTEIEVSSGNAHLLVNTSGSAGIPPFLKLLALQGYSEVLSMRTAYSRHFYNEESNSYRYMSDELVRYENQWTPFEEYPIRFILRLRNSTIHKFDSASGISDYIALIDNSTIWGIGIETFSGILGFYLNFQDVVNGHGQYLYYPRLRNGELTAFNQPQYAIYPHIFAKVGAQWFDQLLNNRSLYNGVQSPRNNLYFSNIGDSFEITFQTLNVIIQGYYWDIIHGFKYNSSTSRFHLITEFRCLDRGFDDIGMAYEITASPQAEGTPFEPNRFLLTNQTHDISLTVQNAWDIGTYLNNAYGRLEIFSKNNESFSFDFNDMELAGFTQKYLSLQDLEMPNYETRKTLRAGMFGYGSYSQNQWITIDPTFSAKNNNDEYTHFVRLQLGVYNLDDNNADIINGPDSSTEIYRGFIAYNIGITQTIYKIENTSMTFVIEDIDAEVNENLTFGLYYNSSLQYGAWNESYGDLVPETVYHQTTYWNDSSFWNLDKSTDIGTNQTIPQAKSDSLLEAWRINHNLDPTSRISMNVKIWNGTGMDLDSDDTIDLYEVEGVPVSDRPTLTFDYSLTPPDLPPELDSPSDKELQKGYSNQNITWIPTERDNSPSLFVVYRNGSLFDSGSWTNQTPIVVDIDSINNIVGMHNFTIRINDTSDLFAIDQVWLNITPIFTYWYYWTNPSITSLNNFSFNLTLRNFIVTSTTDINSSIKFQLAINNQFKYWNGSAWENITVGQNNTYYFNNEANSESIVDSNLPTIASEGNISIRAFLHNEYNSTPYLDNIFIETFNETFPVVGLFSQLIKNNSFSNLGFGFDFITVNPYLDINAYNFTNGNNLTFYILYVLPFTTESFLNGVILYKLVSVENITKTIDIPKISLQTLDIANSDKKNISLVSSYHYRDLIILIEANGNPIFNGYLELEIVWYKTEIEIQKGFVEDILAFDEPLDFPIFLLLMPIILIFAGDQFALIAGITIGIVEIILALRVIQHLRGAI